MTSRNGALVFAGISLVLGFFLPLWGDGMSGISGFDMVTEDFGISAMTKIALYLLPLAGIALLAAGLSNKGKVSRGTALLVGIGVLGYVAYMMVRLLFALSGCGMFLVIAGGIAALVVGLRGSASNE